MITTPYKTIARFESAGSDGTLGLRIEVAGSNLPDTDQESIRYAAQDALKKIEEEITAAIKAADPKAQENAKAERDQLLGCFKTPIYVEDIPNGCCNQGCCRHLPWFVVTTSVGRIKIGWSKRVINIDWSETQGTAEADELFPAEDTTKGAKYIHAWTVEKAADYVEAVLFSGMNAQVKTRRDEA